MIKLQTFLSDSNRYIGGICNQIVQHIDFVGLTVRDVNENGKGATQVQQHVQLDRSLGRAKRCHGKHQQAQVDRVGPCVRLDDQPHSCD